MPEYEHLFEDPITGPLYTTMVSVIAAIFGLALTRRTKSRLWTLIIATYVAFMAVLAVASFFELRRVEREQAAEEQEEVGANV